MNAAPLTQKEISAVKFYTEEGNWDLVGNNTPTFFLRDVHNFPDLNRAVKRDPRTGIRSAQNNWDFWTLLPETFHQTTVVMSDRGIPASFRHMHFYGEHTFSFYNDKNERVWCKFHFKTQQGIKNLTDAEAEALIAKDRESHGRDLYEAIERGDYPRWTMYVQIMTEEQALNTTKIRSTSQKSGGIASIRSTKSAFWNLTETRRTFLRKWNRRPSPLPT